MRQLLDVGGGGFDPQGRLPSEFERVLKAGWRKTPDGLLLLAPGRYLIARKRLVLANEVGAEEYEHNDFSMPDQDLARAVRPFAPRFADGAAYSYDHAIDYRGPDGQFPADVAAYLHRVAGRD